MIPGAPHPLMLSGGGDPIDELGAITHMLRTRASAGGHLAWTPTSAGDRTKWVAAFCFKAGSSNPATAGVFSATKNDLGVDTQYVGLSSTSWEFSQQTSSAYTQAKVSSAKYRDYSSLRFVVVNYDSSNATASERLRIEIDGVRVSAFSVSLDPGLGALSFINGIYPHRIGRAQSSSNTFSDQLLGNFCFIDGKNLSSASFWQAHPLTKQWRPKTKAAIRAAVAAGGGVRNGWGANGCFLPFDPNDFAAGVVYDRSQSDIDTAGNNWTLNNINVTTPGPTFDLLMDGTDNVATWNPLATNTAANLLDGNLKSVGANGSVATMPIPVGGVWQWEVEFAAFGSVGANGSGLYAGVYSGSTPASSYALDTIPGGVLMGWSAAPSAAFTNNTNRVVDGVRAVWPAGNSNAVAAGRIAGFVADFTGASGKLSAYLDGVYVGDLSTSLDLGRVWLPAITAQDTSSSGQTLIGNFGQRPLVHPIAGAKRLCAKNLPYPKIPNPATAFAAVTDSGASILAALAAARAGWPAYIDIVKRRDPTAEGWRWSFSDDPGYALDCASGTAGRFAYPSLGGASYIGYSLKVSAYNGVATGRLAHVSGTADVVVDGLGNARKAIILVSETSGNLFFYNPDLTSGKLLYLNLYNAETPDASIGTILSNSFTVVSALPTGTYRWIALVEVNDFLKLGKYSGTGSADGPNVMCGHQSGFLMTKRVDSTGGWNIGDSRRDPTNVVGSNLAPESTGGESPGNSKYDITSNGFKVRSATFENVNGATYVFISIADHPFRYANAR